MKKITLLIILFSVSWICPAQHGTKYDAYWILRHEGNKPLKDLSYKILQAISKNKIQALDKDGKAITKDQLLERMPYGFPNSCLTLEEIKIMLDAGDLSFLPILETPYTEADIEKMMKEGKDYRQYFQDIKFKKVKTFETRSLHVEIHEELVLDTTLASQKGTVKSISLIISKGFISSNEDVFFSKVNYEDLKKLKLKPEQEIIDQRQFKISSNWDDLTITNEKETYQLSKFVVKTEKFDRMVLDQMIFRYFKKSIKLFDEDSHKWVDY